MHAELQAGFLLHYLFLLLSLSLSHTHTHTHFYIMIFGNLHPIISCIHCICVKLSSKRCKRWISWQVVTFGQRVLVFDSWLPGSCGVRHVPVREVRSLHGTCGGVVSCSILLVWKLWAWVLFISLLGTRKGNPFQVHNLLSNVWRIKSRLFLYSSKHLSIW